jgi:hypothetical protein
VFPNLKKPGGVRLWHRKFFDRSGFGCEKRWALLGTYNRLPFWVTSDILSSPRGFVLRSGCPSCTSSRAPNQWHEFVSIIEGL